MLVLAVGVAAAAAPSSSRKLSNYEALRKQQGSRAIVRATDANLQTYLGTGPRPYDLFVMFTALGAKYKCAVCQKSLEEFELAAEQYSYAAAGEVQKPSRPSLFMVADLSQTKGAFQGYDVSDVEHIPYII